MNNLDILLNLLLSLLVMLCVYKVLMAIGFIRSFVIYALVMIFKNIKSNCLKAYVGKYFLSSVKNSFVFYPQKFNNFIEMMSNEDKDKLRAKEEAFLALTNKNIVKLMGNLTLAQYFMGLVIETRERLDLLAETRKKVAKLVNDL